MPDRYKTMIPTLINAYDVSTFVVLSLFYKYVEPDTDRILNILYILATVVSVLYLILIPESPKWLLMKKG